jgi:vacuolar iron transporter family protein
MQAQRELLQRELEVERQSLRRAPEAERRELTAIYERRGLDPGLAAELVDEVMRDPDVALETHAREELGIDPGSLGSPWRAAVSSFVTFAVGALLPLLPWLFSSGTAATLASVAVGVVASLLVGGAVGFYTGRSPVRSALRQLAVAVLAAGVTYGIGRAVGASMT